MPLKTATPAAPAPEVPPPPAADPADPAAAPPAPPPPAKARKGATKTIAKKPRAKSAFSFFASEYRGTIPEAERANLGAVSKRIAQAWQDLEDKAKYEALAADDRARLAADAPPPKEKKPPSAYIRFSTAERAKIKAETPGLAFGDIAKRCAEAWKALGAAEKEAWKAPAAEVAA